MHAALSTTSAGWLRRSRHYIRDNKSLLNKTPHTILCISGILGDKVCTVTEIDVHTSVMTIGLITNVQGFVWQCYSHQKVYIHTYIHIHEADLTRQM